MRTAKPAAAAVLLVVAGCDGSPAPPPPSPPVAAPLVMTQARASHTATPLPDGRVLIAGGCARHLCDGAAAAGTELFDPRTGRFAAGPAMRTERAAHTATALPGGRVLVVGGFPQESAPPSGTAEVYDPATGRFEPAGRTTIPRGLHTATRLRDGRVLIAGGSTAAGSAADVEVYDPATGRFTAVAPMPGPRSLHAATLLGDGRVLVAGGQAARGTLLDTACLYDPAADAWHPAGRLGVAKYKLALAPLPDGGALLVGGQTSDDAAARLAGTERFEPRSAVFTPGPSMAEPRYKISEALVVLPDGRVVIAGGFGVEVYAGGALRSVASGPGPERQFPAAALLPGGRVLVTGGYDNATQLTAGAVVVEP